MRLRIWVFDRLTTLSLLLCIASGVMWVRSYWIGDAVVHEISGRPLLLTDCYQIVSRHGLLAFEYMHFIDRTPALDIPLAFLLLESSTIDGPAPVQSGAHGFAGFEWEVYTGIVAPIVGKVAKRGITGPSHVHISVFRIPWLMLVLTAAILPLIRLRRAAISVNQQLRARRGLCTYCGYDLRATKSRCPECGTVAVIPEIRLFLISNRAARFFDNSLKRLALISLVLFCLTSIVWLRSYRYAIHVSCDSGVLYRILVLHGEVQLERNASVWRANGGGRWSAGSYWQRDYVIEQIAPAELLSSGAQAMANASSGYPPSLRVSNGFGYWKVPLARILSGFKPYKRTDDYTQFICFPIWLVDLLWLLLPSAMILKQWRARKNDFRGSVPTNAPAAAPAAFTSAVELPQSSE
jgi:hypothetical protein